MGGTEDFGNPDLEIVSERMLIDPILDTEVFRATVRNVGVSSAPVELAARCLIQ